MQFVSVVLLIYYSFYSSWKFLIIEHLLCTEWGGYYKFLVMLYCYTESWMKNSTGSVYNQSSYYSKYEL